MQKNNKSAVVGLSVALLILSLVPLLMLSHYTRPVADDFGYGGPVYYALKNGGGLFDILEAIAENIRYTYLNWQGTFTSVFLFSVQPGSFYEGLYAITPAVMIFAIICSIYLLTGMLRCLETWGRAFIGSIVSVIAVQFLPSAADGMFWWNGASHYVLCWLLLVITIVFQVRILREDLSLKKFILFLCISCLFAFFTGGANYSIALVCPIVSIIFVIYSFAVKKSRKVIYALCLNTIFSAAGLFISMMAPGNAVRQAGFEKMNPVSAVFTSFQEASRDIVSFTNIAVIGAILLCVPVFIMSLKKRQYKFRYPLLVVSGSFCIFASMYTPPLYAMGFCHVPRMNNMFYLAYLVWIFGNSFYIAGWLYFRYFKQRKYSGVKIATVIGAILFLAALMFQAENTNSFMAYSDLKSEVLQTYIREVDERTKAYEDKTASERFVPITEYPKCFVPARHLTWSSDLLLNDLPTDLPIYRSCGGEVTFIGYDDAINYFDCADKFTLQDFDKTFYINDKVCVPLRDVAGKLGMDILYDGMCDTIYLVKK